MAILGLDLGGTKLSVGLFDTAGKQLYQQKLTLDGKVGTAVGMLLGQQIRQAISSSSFGDIEAVGIAVPGIYNPNTGKVWAPNIPGWEDYPLRTEMQKVAGDRPVLIDSDRSCCILGEIWMGNARNCLDAIFLTVGTGIAAGIMAEGRILKGANNIAGALGWMAIDRNYEISFKQFGCLETYGSGDGVARLAEKLATDYKVKDPVLMRQTKWNSNWKAVDIFLASDRDLFAKKVLDFCIQSWGMTVANLVSIFNPEKIIFGGGVFGPALKYLPAIEKEAANWAQPLSQQSVTILGSALEGHAALFGAACLTQQHLPASNQIQNV